MECASESVVVLSNIGRKYRMGIICQDGICQHVLMKITADRNVWLATYSIKAMRKCIDVDLYPKSENKELI